MSDTAKTLRDQARECEVNGDWTPEGASFMYDAADEIDALNATLRGAKLCSRGWSVEYGWNSELQQHGFYAQDKVNDWCEWAGATIDEAWRLIDKRHTGSISGGQ